MEDVYNNYRMIEEVKRGSDRVAKIERRSGVEDYAAGFSDYHS